MPELYRPSRARRTKLLASAFVVALLAGCSGSSTGTGADGDSGLSSSGDAGSALTEGGGLSGDSGGSSADAANTSGGDGGVLPDAGGSGLLDGGNDGASVADGSASVDSSSIDSGSNDGEADSGAEVDSAGTADSGDKEASVDSGGGVEAGKEAGADSGGGTVDATAPVDSGEGSLPDGATGFPAPNSEGICPDPPLRIAFSGPPKLGTAGKIQVFNSSGTSVASVDMAATAFTNAIGGTTFNIARPVYVDGDSAVIYLKSHALTYGQTYYVTVDSGAIIPPTGTFSVTGTTTWRFSTIAAAPSKVTSLTVALNGSGNFCSVQGAIDAIPANNTAASQILIDTGIYHEIIHFASKNNVTLIGQSRTGTIIEGTNNNNMNPTTVTRSLVGIDSSSGLVIDTMTISNLTPQGGSQAEALRLERCDECIVRNANVNSLQDTLLWDGRLYADNCTISGNVDFVWSSGAAYFNNCVIHTVGQAGAIVQARNTPTGYGYVFVDSQLTADASVKNQVLARIDVSQYPGSHVAYINCTMGSFISPAGWTITGGTPTSELRFWEYQSVDTSGTAIDVSKRIAGSTQISATEAASMRDRTVVLAGWNPQ